MSNEDSELSTEEAEELQRYLSQVPQKEEKTGIFNFFNKVFKAKDTKKGSYLSARRRD